MVMENRRGARHSCVQRSHLLRTPPPRPAYPVLQWSGRRLVNDLAKSAGQRLSWARRCSAMSRLAYLLFAMALVRAQPGAGPKAPADVQPGSITYEDVAYPHPVSYLPLTVYGQD